MSAKDVRDALAVMVAADDALQWVDGELARAIAAATAAKTAQEAARLAWATAAQCLALALGPMPTPEQAQAAALAVTVPKAPRLAEPEQSIAATVRAGVLRELAARDVPVALAYLIKGLKAEPHRVSRQLTELKALGKVVQIGRGFWQLATWAPPKRDTGAGRDYRKGEGELCDS